MLFFFLFGVVVAVVGGSCVAAAPVYVCYLAVAAVGAAVDVSIVAVAVAAVAVAGVVCI